MAKPDQNMILMGRIGAAHGIRGQVRIQPFTDTPMALVEYGRFTTRTPDQTITITGGRGKKDMLIATIKGIADRTAAEALNGVELFVPRDLFPVSEGPDEFYLADLIGLAARDGSGKTLGTVTAFFDHGAGDIIEIAHTGGGKLLLAFTAANVPEIEVGAGFLVVSLPTEIDGEPRKKPPRS
jgi:16S rRNA processing protein RimM